MPQTCGILWRAMRYTDCRKTSADRRVLRTRNPRPAAWRPPLLGASVLAKAEISSATCSKCLAEVEFRDAARSARPAARNFPLQHRPSALHGGHVDLHVWNSDLHCGILNCRRGILRCSAGKRFCSAGWHENRNGILNCRRGIPSCRCGILECMSGIPICTSGIPRCMCGIPSSTFGNVNCSRGIPICSPRRRKAQSLTGGSPAEAMQD